MRIKITAGQTNPFTRFNQISLPTNVDPSLWAVGDATITLQGPNPTDVTRVIRVSDNTVLYSFTGAGEKAFTVGANFDVACYFRREDAGGTVLMRTLPATQRLNFGNNGVVSLFYGAEVQLAQASDLATILALVGALPADVHDRALETGFSLAREIRIIAAAVAGKVTGAPGAPVFRNLSDSSDQITGTADPLGNRTTAGYGS